MNYKIINNIKDVSDIKKLSFDELNVLADEVRDLIIDGISKNGGHLASSLGVVELTIALIKVYNFPYDKIIFDVGHQSYAYKILTDRKNAFSDIRSYGGISGFPKRKESPFDSFDTGHSSTSISAGLGMCTARDINNDDYKVVSVIGDGSLTGGMAFEALNNLSNLTSNFVVILNDNEMSISKSNGGLSKALIGIRSSTKYGEIKRALKNNLEKNAIGIFIKGILVRIINIIKQFIVTEGMFFEDLNINYVGPIDGHNIKELVNVIETARNSTEPLVVHVKTKKGKGYKFAEENPTLYHGVSPFDKNIGITKEKSKDRTYTEVFSNKIIELAKKDKNIVTITAAMPDGTGLTEFAKLFKNRFFDVGIAEQHAVTFAAGLATKNILPVVCIYSSFLQRAFDQIIHDVALQNQHVVFMIDRAGLVGKDGETHQGIFDISYLRLVPNMTILAPKNDLELERMIEYSLYSVKGPVAIRYPRGVSYTNLHEYNEELSYGKAELISYDEDSPISIFALGSMVSTAINVSKKLLSKNVKANIINLRFAKPIDFSTIDKVVSDSKTKIIITLEENVESGGIGEAISTHMVNNVFGKKVINICLPDAYIEHGSVDILREVINIDSDSIVKKIMDVYGKL